MRSLLAATMQLLRGGPVGSRLELGLRLLLVTPVAVLAVVMALDFVTPLTDAPPRKTITVDTNAKGDRFGVALSKRQRVFKQLAGAFERAYKNAKRKFKKHKWSQQDDRARKHLGPVRSISKRNKLPTAVGYMIFEEGVHKRWHGPKKKPVPTHIEPFKIRAR